MSYYEKAAELRRRKRPTVILVNEETSPVSDSMEFRQRSHSQSQISKKEDNLTVKPLFQSVPSLDSNPENNNNNLYPKEIFSSSLSVSALPLSTKYLEKSKADLKAKDATKQVQTKKYDWSLWHDPKVK